MYKTFNKKFVILMIIISLILLAMSIPYYISYKSEPKYSSYIKTRAKIVERLCPNQFITSNCDYKIEYEVDNEPLTSELTIEKETQEESIILIWYDKNNPNNIISDEEYSNNDSDIYGVYIFGGFALFCILSVFVYIIKYNKKEI